MVEVKYGDEAGRLAALHRYQVLDTAREESFDKITGLVRNVLDVPMAAVTLVDSDRQWFKAQQGLGTPQTPREQSFCAHTIQQPEVMCIPDAAHDPRFADNGLVTGPPHIRSYLGAQLTTPDGYNLGALCAIDTHPRAFDDNQANILRNFAQLVLDELDLRQVAASDPLTGVLTRGGWLESARKLVESARVRDEPAAVAMLDVDHFKSVNDTHGHRTGDEVLREVVERCCRHLTDGDALGRMGGEEFAVLLPGRDAAAAREVVRAEPVVTAETRVPVTASFGVAPLHAGIADAESWLAAADALLYAAKEAGRDTVRLAADAAAATGS